jgi:hypothetical protein
VKRREFIAALGGAAAAWPLAARAQQPERMRRIGVLTGDAEDDPGVKARLAAFREGLDRLGWSREALPISNREGQEALSDARGRTGHGSPEGRAKRKLSARLLHGGSDGRTARRKGAAS